ncbi:SAUR-like auxin-responsive protein family [Striga asiatica]|uniref:SAUR-like auxin-responsive protein family n=1 Tax=Striga asiatica TaxID=4170 RepID=A0A5A7PU30_STRAF|nr:SAUR-like auxin-responsive protein family [Striga asiatica]
MASAGKKSNMIGQIVRLRRVVRRWKDKSLRRGGSSSSSDTDDCEPRSPRRRTPAGSVAVYAGLDRRRFVVPTRFLNLPVFAALLDQAEEEFGYQPAGGLVLACAAGFLSGVIRLLELDEERFCGLGLDEFVRMVSGADLDLDLDSDADLGSAKAFVPLLRGARV